jgi:phosphoglycolate phosphatase-like HAD superfamily hydrolase
VRNIHTKVKLLSELACKAKSLVMIGDTAGDIDAAMLNKVPSIAHDPRLRAASLTERHFASNATEEIPAMIRKSKYLT